MVYSQFGLDQLTESVELDRLLKVVEKVDSLSAQLLLREAYEISYRIHDHAFGTYHAWNLALNRPKENYCEYGTLYRTVHAYHLREVHKRFGYNLTEFLDLPRELVELIFKICETEGQQDAKSFSIVKKELDANFGKT